MNIYDHYDIDYENMDKKLFIRIISQENKFLGILMDNNELILEVHYDKKLQQFALLDGVLGNKLRESNLPGDTQLDRVLEVFNNKLWNYFNPEVNKTKRIP